MAEAGRLTATTDRAPRTLLRPVTLLRIAIVVAVLGTWELVAASGLLYRDVVPSLAAIAVALGKTAFYRQIEMDLSAAYACTSEVMTTNMLAYDAAEGIDAFIEKRQPHWRDA